jgi:hypothetical protein
MSDPERSAKMKKRAKANIPTEAEFDAASKAMSERIREEQRLKNSVIELCAASPVFHDIYVWIAPKQCGVDLFVKTDADMQGTVAAKLKNDIASILRGLVGTERQVTVDLDSHEHVVRDYEGSYFYRLR